MTTIRHTLGKFALVPEYIVASASPPAQKMWCVLWIYSGNGTHEAWPSHSRLAADMGISRRTVQRIIDELTELGALTIRPRTGTSNLYTLQWSPASYPQDTSDATPCVTHDAPPASPMTHKERLSEIDKRLSTSSDTSDARRTPGDAPLTREQIRQIREQHAQFERDLKESTHEDLGYSKARLDHVAKDSYPSITHDDRDAT